jgi:hypothetical protein
LDNLEGDGLLGLMTDEKGLWKRSICNYINKNFNFFFWIQFVLEAKHGTNLNCCEGPGLP